MAGKRKSLFRRGDPKVIPVRRQECDGVRLSRQVGSQKIVDSAFKVGTGIVVRAVDPGDLLPGAVTHAADHLTVDVETIALNYALPLPPVRKRCDGAVRI